MKEGSGSGFGVQGSGFGVQAPGRQSESTFPEPRTLNPFATGHGRLHAPLRLVN